MDKPTSTTGATQPQRIPGQTYIPPEMPRRPYHQACAMQKLAWDLANDPTTKQSTVAHLLRAWDVLEERKRVLKMRAAPKPIDPTELERAKERRKAAKADGQAPGWRGKPRSTPAPVAQVIHMPVDNPPATDAGSESAAK